MATKRNALGVLMGIELVLNGANVNFVAFGSDYLRAKSLGLDGQLMALFVIVLAAAEAAVALGDCLELLQQPHHDRRGPRRRVEGLMDTICLTAAAGAGHAVAAGLVLRDPGLRAGAGPSVRPRCVRRRRRDRHGGRAVVRVAGDLADAPFPGAPITARHAAAAQTAAHGGTQ